MLSSNNRLILSQFFKFRSLLHSYSTEAVAVGPELGTPLPPSISQFLEKQTSIYPDKDVLRFCHQYSSDDQSLRWTWSELQRYSDALACGFVAARIRPGDSVVLQMPSESENLLSVIAAGKMGARAVQIDDNSGPAAVREALRASNARSAIFAPVNQDQTEDRVAMYRQVIPELQDWPWDEPLRLPAFPNLKAVVQIGSENHQGFLSFRDIFLHHPWPSPLPAIAARLQDGQAPLLSVLQQGPAPLDFSQAAVLRAASSLADRLALTPDDRVASALPLDTPLGQTALFAVMAARAVMIVVSATPDAPALLAGLRDEHASVLVADVSSLQALLQLPADSPTPAGLKKILVVASEQAPLPASLLASAAAAFPGAVVSVALAHPASPGLVLQSAGAAQAQQAADGAVCFGAPSSGVTARVLDAAGKPVARGARGSLAIQGTGLAGSVQASGVTTTIPAIMNQDGSVSILSK